ncbi:MAG: DNA polymerase III subunit gamma/tau [Chloroflexi bacterium]|nr:DNA polymerase III subunit gamma/tau [Chloroflexota bacterium]
MTTPVLYRKWRPQTLAEVVGQEAVTRTLRNAVATGRTAHAYLFTGPRGTGKTSTARILAKAVNCPDLQDGDPCDRCPSCRTIAEGASLDVIEIDAASNRGIDDVRDLREKIKYMHGAGRYKVYIIDEVHMLSEPAFNALLKTLEEPPPHAILVLATTEAHRVPATILSRCQRFDFRRVPHGALVDRLAVVCQREGVAVEPAGLDLIARSSGGGLRDALNILEQLMVSYGREVTLAQVQTVLGLTGDPRALELVHALVRRDIPGGLTLINRVSEDGIDLRQFNREVVEYLRALVLIAAGTPEVLDLPGADREALAALAQGARLDDLTRATHLFSGVDFRQEHRPSLALELALLELALSDQAAPARSLGTAPTVGRHAGPGTTAAGISSADATGAPEPPPGGAGAAAGDVPEPAPPPSAGAADPGAGADQILEEVRRALKTITLEKRFGIVQALLRTYVSVERVEDGTIYLGFRHSSNKERMEDPKNLEAAEAAISQALGRRWHITCVDVKEPQPVGHLVRKAQELGFRVVEGTTEDT